MRVVLVTYIFFIFLGLLHIFHDFAHKVLVAKHWQYRITFLVYDVYNDNNSSQFLSVCSRQTDKRNEMTEEENCASHDNVTAVVRRLVAAVVIVVHVLVYYRYSVLVGRFGRCVSIYSYMWSL